MFAFGSKETGLGADSVSPTVSGAQEFGLISGHQGEGTQTRPAKFLVDFIRYIARGGGPAGETTKIFYTGGIVQVLKEAVESKEQRNLTIVSTIHSTKPVDFAVRPMCTYGVTPNLGDAFETEVSRAVARGIWRIDTVTEEYGSSAEAAILAQRSPLRARDEGIDVLSAVPEMSEALTRDRVLDHIRRLRSAPEAVQPPWAESPAESTFNDAKEFVTAWPSVKLLMPDVGLADDGEVNFLWKGRELHVDLGFYGDGTFSYFARDRDGVRYADDDVAAGCGLPEKLIAILKA